MQNGASGPHVASGALSNALLYVRLNLRVRSLPIAIRLIGTETWFGESTNVVSTVRLRCNCPGSNATKLAFVMFVAMFGYVRLCGLYVLPNPDGVTV